MNCEILLADEHECFRAGLKSLLQPLKGMSVCAESGDGKDTIEKARLLRPQIIIASLSLPKANGLIVARRVRETNPQQKLLIVTTLVSSDTIRDLLTAGVQGLISKSAPVSEVVSAVEALRINRTYFPSEVDALILDGFLQPRRRTSTSSEDQTVSVREHEVLQLLAEGATTKDVAVTLKISIKTAETHRSRLMRKLHVHNLAEITLYAVSRGIVQAPVLSSITETTITPRRNSVRDTSSPVIVACPSEREQAASGDLSLRRLAVGA